jgi:hypothetical protein
LNHTLHQPRPPTCPLNLGPRYTPAPGPQQYPNPNDARGHTRQILKAKVILGITAKILPLLGAFFYFHHANGESRSLEDLKKTSRVLFIVCINILCFRMSKRSLSHFFCFFANTFFVLFFAFIKHVSSSNVVV